MWPSPLEIGRRGKRFNISSILIISAFIDNLRNYDCILFKMSHPGK